MGVTMARGRRPLDTTTDTTAMADTADTGVVMATAKERQSQAITVVVIMDIVATEATVDMADMVMASGKLRLAIATDTRATVVDMEEATDMAMGIMVRPALVQEFSAQNIS